MKKSVLCFVCVVVGGGSESMQCTLRATLITRTLGPGSGAAVHARQRVWRRRRQRGGGRRGKRRDGGSLLRRAALQAPAQGRRRVNSLSELSDCSQNPKSCVRLQCSFCFVLERTTMRVYPHRVQTVQTVCIVVQHRNPVPSPCHRWAAPDGGGVGGGSGGVHGHEKGPSDQGAATVAAGAMGAQVLPRHARLQRWRRQAARCLV